MTDTNITNVNLISELVTKILNCKKLYYAGKSQVSDQEYDGLEARLRAIAPDHPVLSYVGFEPESSSSKVTHDVYMLSLEKTYELKDLTSWIDGKPVVGMLKIDGNSLSLKYKGGQLVQAITRGNGRVGEDVSDKAKWVPDIAHNLGVDFDVEIRGELYCGKQNFAKLSEEMISLGLDAPTSPRNIVAGLLGRKSYARLAIHFNFFAFEVLVDNSVLQFDSELDKVGWLESKGFKVPEPRLLKTQQDVESYLARVKGMLDHGDFGLDGAVFTYDDIKLHAELGNTAHHPRYKLSFKWQGQTDVSEIKNILWSTSRLGIVTPVAIVEPVYLSGAHITNVTLHNAAHVIENNLKVGDRIEIVRSGEVIPKFLTVIEAALGSYVLPDKCPSCGSKLEFDDIRLKCSNTEACSAQKGKAILNWIQCAQIDDLSEKRLEQLIECGFVKDISDLYKLKESDFLQLPLTQDKMASKLYTNIQKSKSLNLVRFLSGLGIESTGLVSWEKLLNAHPSLDEILNLSVEDIVAIDGFAERSATQIVTGLKQKRALIGELLSVGVSPVFEVKNTSQGSLSGKQFVITGTLSQPRSEIEKIIKDAGGKVASSVSKNTFAIVTNDTDSNSSKMKKALELNIQIWNERKLLEELQSAN